MDETFITIVGFSNYFGKEPFKIGTELKCIKKPDNAYANEAIKAMLPVIGTVGYAANGVNTKTNGTSNAGRIYDKVGDKFIGTVLFITNSKVICRVENYYQVS